MSRANIDLSTDDVQIYFSDDSPCYDIKVRADFVDEIIIEDNFLKVHDLNDSCWHCYNINQITHFHYPDSLQNATRVKRNDKRKAIKELEQEPKTGHWIEHEQYGILHIECSECSTWFLKANLTRNSYCPNCGAKMIESEEEDHEGDDIK